MLKLLDKIGEWVVGLFTEEWNRKKVMHILLILLLMLIISGFYYTIIFSIGLTLGYILKEVTDGPSR